MRRFHYESVVAHKRKKLPHWDADHAIQFVTFSLDRANGIRFSAETAAVIVATILHDDEHLYELLAWCVMPDHVHVVLHPMETTVATIVKAWKSVSTRKVNTLLARTGGLWQRDYFDRLVRNSAEFEQTIEYVVTNPLKAELFDWPFVGMFADRIADLGWG